MLFFKSVVGLIRGSIRRGTDLVIQPVARSRVLSGLLIRPDMFLLCGGDPDKIVERKPELTPSEVARQLAEWRRVTGSVERVDLNTVHAGPIEVVELGLEAIHRERARRLRHDLRPVAMVPPRLHMVATSRSKMARKALYTPSKLPRRIASALSFRARLSSEETATFADHVVHALSMQGIAYDSLAAIRSLGREQLVVAVIRNNKVAEFVKMTWGGRDVLEHEARALDSMKDCPTLRVPHVISFEKRDDLAHFE